MKRLSFDGRTGPYIQNAHVRANSILEKGWKVKVSELATCDFDYELTKHEIELIEQISRFPNAVQQAANEYRPLVMAAYAYDLANAFHSFYHAVPVLQSEDEDVRECPSAAGGSGQADDRECPAVARYPSAGCHVKIRLNVIFTFSLFYLKSVIV